MKLGESPVALSEADMKKLNVDRYSAYKVLAKYGLALLAYCWAHVRRDFIDIQKKFPKDRNLYGWAEEWVVRIAELYRINNERVKYPKGTEPFLQYDTLLRKALAEMKADSEKKYDDDAQTGAMNSMKEHWSGLVLFVEYPELPMDNNLMENGIRPCALGRNNFLGSHSIWGGNLAACMYSIIQTCLLNKISPRDYLLYYFNVCANAQNLPRLSGRWQNFLVMIFCFSVFFVRRFSLTLDCGTPVPLCFYSGAVHLLHLKCN